MAKVTTFTIFLCLFFLFAANCSNNVGGEAARAQVPGADVKAGVTSPPGPLSGGEGETAGSAAAAPDFQPAAYRTETYLPLLRDLRVALVVNQTSVLGATHLVDTLLAAGVDVRRIFAPEHGFRGAADAGATITDGRDDRSGLPIKSLYGKSKKPSAADLADIDVIVFDIQDVGARFYTYISTLYYVMDAAADHGKRVLVLDRPNPNGHYVAGPVLDPAHQSFVGIAPLPVVHGLTVGEFANMANGEGWLPDGKKAPLSVIPMAYYDRTRPYSLPVPPSPNLPNDLSIALYPTLCFFEGTALSVGRGTNRQFQLYGHPKLTYGEATFTPRPGPGSGNPKLNGETCRGVDLSGLTLTEARAFTLNYDLLVKAYRDLTDQGVPFFTRPDFFDLLAGGPGLRRMIEAGNTGPQIAASFSDQVTKFGERRQPYLLY